MRKNKKHIDVDTVKFGEHLIFDAYGCDPKKLNSKTACENALEKMAKLAGMKKISDPYVLQATGNETLGGKDPGGFSGFLIIQESHISIHTFTKRGFVTIDLYSCKNFMSAPVIEYLIDTFRPKNHDIIKIERGLKYPKNNIY